MGLSWQQGPLSPGAIGRFLVPEPLPKRLLYAEPLRRRMRVRFGGAWIADSEHVLLLFEPGRYPVAYFPETDVSSETLERNEHTTRHTSGSLPGIPSVRARRTHRVGHGSTSSCRPTRASCERESRLLGRPWTPSTKKTNGSWAMPPTATIALISASLPVAWWSATVTAPSLRPSGR